MYGVAFGLWICAGIPGTTPVSVVVVRWDLPEREVVHDPQPEPPKQTYL